ncbi:MAG: PKD domain-containing protein [Patescibacteria group bacterium]
MKLNNFNKLTLSVIVAAAALLPLSASAITPGSIPYQGEETSGVNFPAFNIFSGVPSVGNEADFIRVKKDGEPNTTLRNTVDTACKTGDRFDVWFYVHNGAKPSLNENGTGPGVAKNVVAKVALPATTASGPITGGVTASNAQAISDTANITCAGKQFKLKYVEGSANAFLDLPNKLVPMPRAIVEGGTPIGTNLLDGNVWGCWEQRVWMGLKVEVEEVPVVVPSSGDCKSIDNFVADPKTRKVSFKITGTTQNATITGYRVDWGDGKGAVETTQDASFTYPKDGTFKIVASVKVKYANGTEEWKPPLVACQRDVTFKTDTPPVVVLPPVTPVAKVTPAALPKTGPADVMGLFAATSAGGAFVHRYILSRRNRY